MRRRSRNRGRERPRTKSRAPRCLSRLWSILFHGCTEPVAVENPLGRPQCDFVHFHLGLGVLKRCRRDKVVRRVSRFHSSKPVASGPNIGRRARSRAAKLESLLRSFFRTFERNFHFFRLSFFGSPFFSIYITPRMTYTYHEERATDPCPAICLGNLAKEPSSSKLLYFRTMRLA